MDRNGIGDDSTPVEWTELASELLVQPQRGVGVAEVEAAGAEDGIVEDVGPGLEEVAQGAEEDAGLPCPVAVALIEPQYPARDRCTPDRLSMDLQLPQKRGRKK